LNPPIPSGFLAVSITPLGAIAAGAQWQVDGGISQPNEAVVSGLSVGKHTVSFTNISGWRTPGNQIVSVSANSASTATGTYVAGNSTPGSLQVTINPEGAITAGAAWEVDGGTPQSSGATVSGLSMGTHTVSFSPISDWDAPPDQMVTITSEVTATASGIYTATNTPANGLTLLTNGYGTIEHTAWPKSLVIGKKYTVTAVPEAKNVLVNWVGGTNPPYSLLSSSARYTFPMEANLLLEVNFLTNVFRSAQGTYRGLFAPASSARQQTNSGSFLFSVTSSGVVSGNLDLGGQSVGLSGKFGSDGAANIVSKRSHGEPSLTTTLQLDFTDQSVIGTVSDGTFTAALNGNLDVFNGSDNAAEFEGQYTLVIPGTNDPTIGPFGASYGTVKVSSSGAITFAGNLADGTAISQSSAVSQDGSWPMYVGLYGGKGSLWSWNYIANNTITAYPSLSWINATNSSKTAVYRSGFTNQNATLMGGIYTPSQTLPQGLAVTLKDGNFTITITNLSENTNNLTLKTNKTTGVISGSFAYPTDPKKTIKINGVILQGQTNTQGYFLETNQSGAFLLENQ
jgi:hypothetical protein